MHLALEEDLSHSTDIQWILGGLAISIVAFLLGCAICRQRKELVIAPRRPAPPSPDPGSLLRYQMGPLSSSASFTVHQIAENADDYEEDFEVPAPRKEPPQPKQNSPSPRKSTTETNSHSSYVNVEPEPSYENVDNSPSKNLRPLKDHTYLELIAGDETTTETLTNLDVKRNALKKSGKSLSIPESLSNSYENVTQQGSPANSELNPDYVNM
ncbi:uncharacterized protein LOC121398099 isoform X2 [Xenopus laevis]|uniref:Uncharacterized protein LOC121398099 isoform X2 n=1 Tax=Xenopus laevis TaxID=8355 RepID=A0A8J1LU74_XENLA|nr:uncharacterized protein LOC121398099 isoform X2 [Xenopus laevis]